MELILFASLTACHPQNQTQVEVVNTFDIDTIAETPIRMDIATPIRFFTIENYETHLALGEDCIVLRKFKGTTSDSTGFYALILYPNTLQTQVIPYPYKTQICTWEQVAAKFEKSRYIHWRQEAKKLNRKVHNAGIRHIDNAAGMVISIDLCPSKHPLDEDLFGFIMDSIAPHIRPLPMVLSASGDWLKYHQKDLKKIETLQQTGKLDITWVNHSMHHKRDSFSVRDSNFMLLPNTIVAEEVLQTEQEMLRQGLLPSCFFRFPGLVSNDKLFNVVLDYGLLPLGTDAWIANQKIPTKGSIVLLHGNGNEPLGSVLLKKRFAEKLLPTDIVDIKKAMVNRSVSALHLR